MSATEAVLDVAAVIVNATAGKDELVFDPYQQHGSVLLSECSMSESSAGYRSSCLRPHHHRLGRPIRLLCRTDGHHRHGTTRWV